MPASVFWSVFWLALLVVAAFDKRVDARLSCVTVSCTLGSAPLEDAPGLVSADERRGCALPLIAV
jgi:hypothetical protein